MSDVAAIIRLCYDKRDEGLFERRMAFFLTKVLGRLKQQSTPVDVWVWVHERHEQQTRMLSEELGFNVFTVDLSHPSIDFAGTKIRGYSWPATQGLPRYPYQILMGSDDFLSPAFTQVSLRAMQFAHGARVLVTHQPLALDLATGKVYEMPQIHRPSPFVVLRQVPSSRAYTWVWGLPHTHLGNVADRSIYLSAGHAAMGINADNDGTKITARMKQIEAPTWLQGVR